MFHCKKRLIICYKRPIKLFRHLENPFTKCEINQQLHLSDSVLQKSKFWQNENIFGGNESLIYCYQLQTSQLVKIRDPKILFFIWLQFFSSSLIKLIILGNCLLFHGQNLISASFFLLFFCKIKLTKLWNQLIFSFHSILTLCGNWSLPVTSVLLKHFRLFKDIRHTFFFLIFPSFNWSLAFLL